MPEPPPPEDDLVRVLPSEECVVGTPQEPGLRCVEVGEAEVILVRLPDGEVVGFASHCPHQGTDLVDASFFDGWLRCPHHLYLYDPRTGENVVPSRDARPENLWKLKPGYLPTHRVEERDGWIWVSRRARPPPAAWDPARELRPAGARRADPATLEPPPRPASPSAAPGPLEHPTRTVRVTPGAAFELRLPVPGLPGHVWRVEVSSRLLAITEERFDPGPPPRHRVRVSTRGAGAATVRCAYARPWDAVSAEVRTYVVRMEEGDPPPPS